MKISQNEIFGLQAQLENTKIIIHKRKSNFRLEFSVDDLKINVFKLGFGQKYPTCVPIIKRSLNSKQKSSDNYWMKL